MPGTEEPSGTPIKRAARFIRAHQLHKLKELLVRHEARITYLPQQRKIASRIDHYAVFDIPHVRNPSSGLLQFVAAEPKTA